ncbi:MAG: hypothetical protein RLZZ230_864 [Candidatus Parcubacteria bacterium]|jgi:large subunit ribosomal protein L9
MKIILLQDVAKIGKRFEVVEVPNGYALNQLIPKRMAELANAINLKKVERKQIEVSATKEAGTSKFEAAKSALVDQKIKIVADANELGHLFKAVHEADIVTAAAEAGIVIDASMLKIDHPIKDVGEHAVVMVQGEHTATITIEVIKK